MKALHVRGIPDELYEALRSAAQDDGRSISAETIVILKSALADRLISNATIMRDIADRRTRIRGPIDPTSFVREDRDR
jgi:plasmid stability protein